MSEPAKRSTIYFDPQLHAALRLKAAQDDRSLSDRGSRRTGGGS